MDDIRIEHSPLKHRYEILAAEQVIGHSRYREDGDQRIFLHTEIDPEFQGHGLATKLIVFALDDTRAAGLRIVAICPMIAAYVKKHHEYDDILDPSGVSPA
jgi:predicted GNAT family acetyltransferase